MTQCPRCGSQVDSLHAASNSDSSESGAAAQVCANCLNEMGTSGGQQATSGGVLMAQEKAKEQHRLMLWKSRVNLIKKARVQMNAKMYAEAAVSYEKYLKIMELVFNLKKGTTLTPEQFKDSARTSEITVVTSVYWDLLRIYDTHEKYHERQQQTARQLALFVRFSPIFPDIIKRAETYLRNAKNPSVFRSFLKNAADQRPRCFIATAAFNDPLSIEVLRLRIYRDFILDHSMVGKIFIASYYFISPPLAHFLERHEPLKAATRFVLRRLIKILKID